MVRAKNPSKSRRSNASARRDQIRVAALSLRKGRPIELIETRERGVKVRLVEQLAPVDLFALKRYEVDRAPFGVETLVGGPLHDVGDDCSQLA